MSEELDIFCVPHAGGSSAFFSYWKKLLPAEQRLVLFDLPGHGRRSGEALLYTAEAAAADLTREFAQAIRGPFVLFGHSMGAHLAYRALQELAPDQRAHCRRLLVSAAKGPQILIEEGVSLSSELPDEAFREHLLTLGVLPPEVAQRSEFLRFFLPLIRADFRICETFPAYRSSPVLDVAIQALGGSDDWVTLSDLLEWCSLSTRPEGFEFLPGEHFYFMGQEAEIFKRLLAGPRPA